MLPLRYGWFWLGGGIALLALIMLLALAPLAGPMPVPELDKALHFLAFAFLTVWFLGVFAWRFALRIAVALAVYGCLIEFVQSFAPFRMADPYDVLSDVIGILAGWLLGAAGLRRWCGRVEAFLGVVPP
jgi:VanZ family protein